MKPAKEDGMRKILKHPFISLTGIMTACIATVRNALFLSDIKKAAIIFVFSGFALHSYSQLKHFLPDTNACMSILDRKYWFEGDTMIDNKRYTKVYEQYCYSATDCGDKYYYAAVREDTLNAKIYCIQTYENVERLLADFNVQEGDTIIVYSFWPTRYQSIERKVSVKSVDSILIDNQYRKRVQVRSINLYSDGEDDSWIEGIGSSNSGLFFPALMTNVDGGDPPILVCFQVNDVLIYEHPWFDSCYVRDWGLLSVPDYKTQFIKVYPTITDDYLYIEQDHLFSLYRIYNNSGQCVQSGRLSETSVSVSALIAGFYYIVFYNEDASRIYSAKFIKR
jgi:hypothetical protein